MKNETLYIVIDWFGSEPYICTNEDGGTISWTSKPTAEVYAKEMCQIGQVVEVPQEAISRFMGTHA